VRAFTSDGSGSKIFDPGQVSNPLFEFEFGKYPKKTSNFSNFFPSDQKKISSGWVKKYPGQKQVNLLFIAGQK